MRIKEIKLINFRNYSKLQLDFCKNYNIIYGKNAQGKTNILEAIFLCSSGRSHRTSKDNELIKFMEDSYFVKIILEKKHTDSIIEIYYKRDERKRIKINEVPIKKNGELMGQLNTVIFSPEDLSIIKDGPLERRRFIDIALSQLKPTYFYDLQQYSRILTQRNHLLKSINKGTNKKNSLRDTLEIWNEKLVEIGSRIILERGKYLSGLNEKAGENHHRLTGSTEEIQIVYSPSILVEKLDDVNNIRKAFMEKIETSEEREIKNGVTLFGPQRDDMEIRINNKNVRIYGSQGQQRTAVLTLKLSEIEILKEFLGEYPILLLDDVFSELDSVRQNYIIESLDNIQAFITTTEKVLYGNIRENNRRLYFVENGMVKAE
ncbi:MAG TPA: DNA replication/repair protein RecF [Clostridiaceae bacterium]|nr:DNA replication/repair protein RecF [Clostridiaceae bacterium]